jgi:RimJ/RimL family protein N-acetyltransferase
MNTGNKQTNTGNGPQARAGSGNLDLVLREPGEVLSWVESMSPAERAQVSPDWLARLRASAAPDPWTCGFALVHRASGARVGTCGYKSPPAPDGVVEIAYGVGPEHRGRGGATEAARALADYAFASSGSGRVRVRVVRAHTLPENSASARVLARCGFERAGEVVDPDDGLVWRWEMRREMRRQEGAA